MNCEQDMKYDAGNIGDILKHSWLIEVTEWLLKQKEKRDFHYADVFCGCYSYTVKPFIKERISKFFQDTRLCQIQEKFLKNGEYLGSVGIVNQICRCYSIKPEIFIFDKDKSKMETFPIEIPFQKLSIIDGYQILEGEEIYDLILIDPYSDFIPNSKKYLKKLINKSEHSSIIIFILNWASKVSSYNKFFEQLKEATKLKSIHAILGRIPTHPFKKGEEKYHFEILFIPKKTIRNKFFIEEIFAKLSNLTFDLNNRVGKETWIWFNKEET
jgi:hypothetical protein